MIETPTKPPRYPDGLKGWLPNDDVRTVHTGDVIQSPRTGDLYLVLENHSDHLLAMHLAKIRHADEWRVRWRVAAITDGATGKRRQRG